MLKTDADSIRRALETRLSVPLIIAGRALGLGRRAALNAAAAGEIPTNVAGGKATVPSAWVIERLTAGGNARF